MPACLHLARPLFEGYLRGMWLAHFVTDDQVDRYHEGKIPDTASLIAALDKGLPEGEVSNLSILYKRNWKAMCGMTHAGAEHFGKWNQDGVLEPAFTEDDIGRILDFAALVSVQSSDITDFPEQGIEIHIRRTKTEQEKGHTVFIPCAKSSRCPVRALKAWLALSGIESGPVFRRINRHDRIASSSALTAQSVALMLKSVVTVAKDAEVAKSTSGHSLRAGYCTEAVSVGVATHIIMDQTGHKSPAMLSRYVRPLVRRKTPSLL